MFYKSKKEPIFLLKTIFIVCTVFFCMLFFTCADAAQSSIKLNTAKASVNQNGIVKAKKKGTVKIKAAGISFTYPSGLKAEKASSEDGSRIEFSTKNGKPAFWYEQGEKWRADLALDQKTYQKLLEDKFKNIQINSYKLVTVNGIKMRRVVFHLTGSKKNQKITEYLMVSKYAFYDFYFINQKDDFVNSLVKSIRFTND